MSRTEITGCTKDAIKDILLIAHYSNEDNNAYAIERLGAIVACAEHEKKILESIKKVPESVIINKTTGEVTPYGKSFTPPLKINPDQLDMEVTRCES